MAATSIGVSSCTASKEYADRGAGGAAGASEGGSAGDVDTGGGANTGSSVASGGHGGTKTASDAAGGAGAGAAGEAGAPGHGSGDGGHDSGDGGHDSGDGGSSTSGQCGAGSDGDLCGEVICDLAFGECTADDPCALTGMMSRTCIARKCTAGECQESEIVQTESCTRVTDNHPCKDPICSEWSECSYGSECVNVGSRTQTCTTFTCLAGACQGVSNEEADTVGCARDTNGRQCGDNYCGSCSFENSCDSQSEKWCVASSCGGGTCNENGFNSVSGCPTQTVCTPGTTQDCFVFDANGCGGVGAYCTGTQTCNGACGWNACVRVAGGCLC
ncbi:MAG TPA: hypothetical protein VI197_31375 [Polyangiaceae bacterium]